jgi:hypothetical protein
MGSIIAELPGALPLDDGNQFQSPQGDHDL